VCPLQEQYFTARANLRQLMHAHPDWTRMQYAEALHMSLGWVKKWLKRIRSADPHDEQVLRGRSSARHHPPARIDEQVVDRLLEYRDSPPEGLGRIPGPKALLYYLHRATDLQEQGLRLPRSTSTIYRLLKQYGRLGTTRRVQHEPWSLPAPGTRWQIDFKDASTVAIEPSGKQQHVVEVLDVVDIGSSQLLEAEVRADFHAQTVLATLADIFQRRGLPVQLTCDRDPRWVASPQGSVFPNAFRRMLSCLGVERHDLPAPAPRSECVCGALSPQLSAGVPGGAAAPHPGGGACGDQRLSTALQRSASQSGAQLWQPTAGGGASAPSPAPGGAD
jgi:hypothetical protein